MTITHAGTTEPTLLEELHALKVTAHRLATERDAAFQMAAQATKDLVRERRAVTVRDAVIKSLRIDADSRNAELRRLNTRVHELAVENEDLRARHDRDQHPQETPPVRASWWSRRIGNQL